SPMIESNLISFVNNIQGRDTVSGEPIIDAPTQKPHFPVVPETTRAARRYPGSRDFARERDPA
ncbi:MAG: hypothetical protein WD397_16050, partial [Wenzhouxiangellaceae bacterium]